MELATRIVKSTWKNNIRSKPFHIALDRLYNVFTGALTHAAVSLPCSTHWGRAGFEPVDLADSGRFNTNSMAFQFFVSSVPIQCVPAEPLPVAFTWHCPGSVGKKREKLPLYPRLLPWKQTMVGALRQWYAGKLCGLLAPLLKFFFLMFGALCTPLFRQVGRYFLSFCSSLWFSFIMAAQQLRVRGLLSRVNTV